MFTNKTVTAPTLPSLGDQAAAWQATSVPAH